MLAAPPITQTPAPRPALWAATGAVSAAVWFLIFQIKAYAMIGQIDYPLDDVYIHLAIGKVIAGGGYGVVPGEASSAGSSILYPLLLTPFAGTEAQRLLPLLWNSLAVVSLGALWGLACNALQARRGAFLLTVFGPLALYISGLAFLGMENALHAVFALLCLFGLRGWLDERRLAPYFIAALILAPLLRFEGLGLSLLCIAVVAATGGFRTGLALLAATLAPLAGFALFLLSLGLAPVPSSVRAKIFEAHQAKSGLEGLITALGNNFSQIIVQVMAVLSILGLVLAWRGRAERSASLVMAVAALATLAHLVMGRIGWLARYEGYVVLLLATGMALSVDALLRRGSGMRIGGVLLVGVLAATRFLSTEFGLHSITQNGPASIRAQQGEMARFVAEHLRAPIAVNDLGYVAWRAEDGVLDLWGLGNPEALRRRIAKEPDWVAPLAEAKGVRHAMIYDDWLKSEMPADWLRIGTLHYTGPRATVYGPEVAFYAHPDGAEAMRGAIRSWMPGLPAMAEFRFDAEPQS